MSPEGLLTFCEAIFSAPRYPAANIDADAAGSSRGSATTSLLQRFDISQESLQQFLLIVQAHYRPDNAFHNFHHAASVLHASHMLLVHAGAAECLSSASALAVLVAAVCHDVDHPGGSNSFEAARGTNLSLIYSDDAPLERHHAYTTMKILRDGVRCLRDSSGGSGGASATEFGGSGGSGGSDAPASCDLTHGLGADERREFRRLVVAAILGTDMRAHFAMVEKLQTRAAAHADGGRAELRAGARVPRFDRGVAADRELLTGAIVHTADLVGQALPWHLATGWGEAVLGEFSEQARMEKELSLPVTPFMQNLHLPARRNDLQAGFVANIVLPLWQAMAALFPGKTTTACVSHCEANHRKYVRQKEEKGGNAAA